MTRHRASHEFALRLLLPCTWLALGLAAVAAPPASQAIEQRAYLKASPPGQSELFGYVVALAGDTAAIASPFERSSATGVNGDAADNGAIRSGAVDVFVRDAQTGAWSPQAYVKASNTGAEDQFGYGLAVDGDTLVVGAHFEDSDPAAGQSDDSAPSAGAVYVFVRDPQLGTWSQQAFLKGSNTEAGDLFGCAVAISGDRLAVGARGEASQAVGVNGNQADNGAAYSGAVYLFVRDPQSGTWTQEAYLKASNTGVDDRFGNAVALEGDTLVVGAYGEASSATGVNGSQADDSASNAGAAYVFVRDPQSGAWSQQAYLKASNTDGGDLFAQHVSLSGDTLVAGAAAEDSAAAGVNGNQASNLLSTSGAAYVFVRDSQSGAWSQQAYLKASNPGQSDVFGASVALSGDALLVGAYSEDSAATGVDGDGASNGANDSGAAYLFARDPQNGTWSQTAYLKPTNTGASDHFGYALALEADTAIVGARYEDSQAAGVNGDPFDDTPQTSGSGAAYVFGPPPPTPASVFCAGDGSGAACPCANPGGAGAGCANGTGAGARLGASGSASIAAADLVLTTSDLVPGQPGLYFQGDNAVAGGSGASFGDGLRCAGGNVVRLQVAFANAGGTSSTTVGVAAQGGVSAGETKRYQLWYRDPATSPCGNLFNLSNGVEVAWLP